MKIFKTVAGEVQTNCYMLSGADFAVVIDPAEYTADIEDFVAQNTYKPHKAVVLTHCHFDHIGGAEMVKQVWNCDIYIGAYDKEGLENPDINFSAHWGDRVISISPDKILNDGGNLILGEFCAKVIYTPGHTKGSICLMVDDKLFCGDTLFNMGIGRTDLPTGDYMSEIKSIKKLFELPADTVVYSGHGPKTTIGFESQSNPYVKEI